MASLDLTSFAAALKQKYDQRYIQRICYKDNPFLALCPKDTKFDGQNRVVALRYGTPQSRSASQSNVFGTNLAKTGKYDRFVITRTSDYAVASITGETIKASENNSGALMRAVSEEIDGALHSLQRSLAISMYGNGGGALGRVGSATNSTTITLSSVTDITNFEVGMTLQGASTDGTTPGLFSGAALIEGIDRINGTLTTSGANWDTHITGLVNGSYLFAQGDFGQKIKGLSGWLPTGALSPSDSFFGVDRNADRTRLAGIDYTSGAGGPIEETLIDAVSLVSREGGTIDYVFMNNLDRANLIKALGSKVFYNRVESNVAGISFKVIEIEGDKGTIKVISDQNCPKGTAYGLQLDTWLLNSLGEAPQILDLDGNKMLREASSDAYTIRMGYYAQLSCDAPGYNVRITL